MVSTKSTLLQMLLVSTAVTSLAVVGFAEDQALAANSAQQQPGRPAPLWASGPVRRLPPVDSPRAVLPARTDSTSVVLASVNETKVSIRSPATSETTKPAAFRREASALSTLHLNDVDVRQVLDMLGRTHGVSILVAPGVDGKVTANLESLDFDAAFGAILKLTDLVADREQGLIYVYARKDYLNDIRVQSFPLDYISVAQVEPVINTLLSDNGQAVPMAANVVDNRRTRESIVVTDTPRVLGQIAQFLSQVDVPPRQVMIEVHILEVTLSDDLRHGINYNQVMNLAGSSVLELDITGFADPMASPAVFASLTGTDVDVLLDLLETTTDMKTLASPRLMVANGQQARLQVGDQLPYTVITVTETAAIEEVKFLDVGVVLEVTPSIGRDGRILMHVKPQISDGSFDPNSGLPGKETREVETDVLLEDGQGMVIGGLIQEEYSDVQTKVPLLGDLYLVGRLFQKRELDKKRTEIVITLVPHIIPLGPTPIARDAIDVQRAATPLYYGALCRLPRPWEPSLVDAVDNPRYLGDGLRLQHEVGCQSCGFDPCNCQAPVMQGDVIEPIEWPSAPTGEPANAAPFVPAEHSAAYAAPPRVAVERSP